MAKRLILGLVMLGLAPSAMAGPLAPEQCAKLTADIAALDQAGIKDLLEKGPAAAKASITKEQRDKVRSYLDTLGQLRFRCPSEAPFVTLKPEPVEDPAEAGAATAPIEANSPGITLPPGIAAAVVAPIVPQKPPVPKVPKATAPAGAAKAPPVAKAPPAAAKTPSAVAPAAPAPATAAPAAAAKAAPTAPRPAGPAPAPAQATTTTPAPKPKPKPKTDDAFKPAEPATQPKSQ